MFRTIYSRIIFSTMAAMCLNACDGPGKEASKEPIEFDSVCELAKGAADLDGRLVRFRSEWELGVEHVRVFGARCPRINLFLHAANETIDLTLCSAEGMRFGCPVNPDFKVSATFTGVLHRRKPGVASVTVLSMTDISSERGAN